MSTPPVLALTQGDPAGIGPEQILGLLGRASEGYRPLVVAEAAALEAVEHLADPGLADRLVYLTGAPTREELPRLPAIPVLDPVATDRTVIPGRPTGEDAAGALAALDMGLLLAREGVADALITGPVSKASIARHCRPGFTGQTEYLSSSFGLEEYGRDYLMAFLGGDLQVALLSTHLPLREALGRVTRDRLYDALGCLARHAPGRVAVPGLNPHAGEGGLLGQEEERVILPALERARAELPELEIVGPESPDSLFGRAALGGLDWILALYHDQGLIAVKTHAWGAATNWTLGLPVIRTSVDHGTAFDIAGQGRARISPLCHVVETTLGLLRGELPRGRSEAGARRRQLRGERLWS